MAMDGVTELNDMVIFRDIDKASGMLLRIPIRGAMEF